MSTDSCIMAIQNFANIRGAPVELYTDCGTNFVGADNELTREIRGIDPERLVNEYRHAKWNFNPPCASPFNEEQFVQHHARRQPKR